MFLVQEATGTPTPVDMDERALIHDWNQSQPTFDWSSARVQLDDETLRDGLQNPSVVDPPIEDKIQLLHMMDQLGIDTANVGLPGAGPRAVKAVTALAREIVDSGLSIQANAAARTVIADVRPIAEISQQVTGDKVKYDVVTDYAKLMDVVGP